MKRWRIAQLFLLLLGTNAQRSTESTLDEGAAAAAGGSAKAVERPPSESDSRPIAIMILALGRSGSTLMGQLFRQNEDVLYMYEPCRGSGQGIMGQYQMLRREECLLLLHRLFRCEFSLLDSDRLGTDASAGMFSSPAVGDVHRSVKASQNGGGRSTEDALRHAHQVLMDTCKKSRVVAVKTIRVLEGFDDATSYLASGAKVLHLVRDPRAVVRSQLLHFSTESFMEAIPNFQELRGIKDGRKRQTETRRALGQIVCHNYRMQLDSSSLLDDGGYLLVRYEDFAMVPQVVTELVYRWSGLGKVPASLVTWIDDNTRMENCDDGADPEKDRDRRRTRKRQLGGGGGGSGGDPAGVVVVSDDGGAKGRGERTGAAAAAATASPPSSKNLRPTEAASSLSVEDVETSLPPLPPRMQHAHESNTSTTPARGSSEASYGLSRRASTTSATTAGGTRRISAPEEESDGLSFRRGSRRALQGSGSARRGGRCDNKNHSRNHPYDTKRHARDMVDLWRQQMPSDDIKAVWDACQASGVMAELRYSP